MYSNLPTTFSATVAIFVDDTANLASHDPTIESQIQSLSRSKKTNLLI